MTDIRESLNAMPINYSINGWIRLLDDLADGGKEVVWVPAGYQISDMFIAVAGAAEFSEEFARTWRFGVWEDSFGVIHSCR